MTLSRLRLILDSLDLFQEMREEQINKLKVELYEEVLEEVERLSSGAIRTLVTETLKAKPYRGIPENIPIPPGERAGTPT